MSHAHGRRASCSFRSLIPWFHSSRLSLAGSVTDVGVGSGALLGPFFIFRKAPRRNQSRAKVASNTWQTRPRCASIEKNLPFDVRGLPERKIFEAEEYSTRADSMQ